MGCKIIKLDDNSTAFLCGGKKNHVCDDKGPVLLWDLDGNEFVQTDDKEEMEIFYHNHNIISGSVSCSICGRPAISDAPYL